MFKWVWIGTRGATLLIATVLLFAWALATANAFHERQSKRRRIEKREERRSGAVIVCDVAVRSGVCFGG